MEEDDTDSEEEEAARKWGRQIRGPQRPPAAQNGQPKKWSGRNKGWMRTSPQTPLENCSKTRAGTTKCITRMFPVQTTGTLEKELPPKRTIGGPAGGRIETTARS